MWAIPEGRYPWRSRRTVAAKSALTGTWGAAAAGADFGMALKAAGYDFVIVEGRAPGSVSYVKRAMDYIAAR